MNSKTALRTAVVAEWFFVITALVLGLLLESRLPQPLQDWLESEADAPFTTIDIVSLALLVILFCAAIVSSVGLLLLQKWARWVYLCVSVVGYSMFPFSGPTVEHALSNAVDELGVLCSGCVLGLAFFSDALKSTPPQDRRSEVSDQSATGPL